MFIVSRAKNIFDSRLRHENKSDQKEKNIGPSFSEKEEYNFVYLVKEKTYHLSSIAFKICSIENFSIHKFRPPTGSFFFFDLVTSKNS